MTSYRRQGRIIRDAISDVDALILHIGRVVGAPQFVALEAESMGGCIATHISELFSSPTLQAPYHAILAIGAALMADEDVPFPFSHQPHLPALYLSNAEETQIIADYIEAVEGQPPSAGVIVPALWSVARNGHCNVNFQERKAALRALCRWAESFSQTSVASESLYSDGENKQPEGDIPRFIDATVELPTRPSQVFYDHDGGWGQVTAIDTWGDVYTNFQPFEIVKLGWNLGDLINVEFGGVRFVEPGRPFKVKYGSNSYLSVDQGQVYCYDHAEGSVAFSANGYARVHRLADIANLKVGSAVFIHRPVGKGATLAGIPSDNPLFN
eukprot:TRINITY_DN1104_c0_g1_i1.p1 TRINITY_DN1104_c0_g1~~TRINITY_DN1104_c0_g1_i1.p1  ORF type:complete len:326 (+),score=68.70 TRINITY_DN1104_c0_g1_i1:339-1316(+)